MSGKAKKQREYVFLVNGIPHNIIMDEDALDRLQDSPLPPDALDRLLAGSLRPGTRRRLRDALLVEAVRQDRAEALPLLLPKNRRLSWEEFDALFQTAEAVDCPDVRSWLLQYRRERYLPGEWDAWQQRKLELELGFAAPGLSELKRLFKLSFVREGVCISGIRKPEQEYAIPAEIEGKPLVSVNAAAFYALDPLPRVSRRFGTEGGEPDRLLHARPGDLVLLGRRAEKKNTAERPIPWRVLLREEDRLLLLCEECVAMLPYHRELAEVDWKSCTLRAWLNQVFLPLAFPPAERARICKRPVSTPGNPIYGTSGGGEAEDYLFLPSAEELRRWLPEESRRAVGRWTWTRSPGFDGSFALTVTPDGSISKVGTFVDAEDCGVRPALWLRAAPEGEA